MVAAFILFAQAQIPTGAYGMPELCRLLTSATGTVHTADARLRDYPVFVSVKSHDPHRVEKLVAAALWGQWVSENGKAVLKAVKPPPKEDFAEFERLFRAAFGPQSVFQKLPMEDLYRMPPGRIERYGATPTHNIQPLPKKLEGYTGDPILIRRMAPGLFQYDMGQSDGEFNGLPKSVSELLGDDLNKQPLSAGDKVAIKKLSSEPTALKVDWRHIEDRDPMATMQNIMLQPVGNAVHVDLVMALPDISIFALIEPKKTETVGSILGQYSMSDMLTVVDGAAIGRLSVCECDYPAQANRAAVQKFIGAADKKGVLGISAISDYMSDQRPTASDSWTDVIMLMMAGLVINQAYVGDYPFNVRLYLSLSKNDWALIRSGRAFPASAFSEAAQEDLLKLLVQSANCLEKERHGDPALWQTLDFSRLTVAATLETKAVLIEITEPGGNISDAKNAGTLYDIHRKSLGHEPLYQPATQQTLELTIRSPAPDESVKTGFSEVTPGKTKPVTWQNLSSDLAAQFKSGIDQEAKGRAAEGRGGGTPPPR